MVPSYISCSKRMTAPGTDEPLPLAGSQYPGLRDRLPLGGSSPYPVPLFEELLADLGDRNAPDSNDHFVQVIKDLLF